MGTHGPLVEGDEQPDVSELQGREPERFVVVPVRHQGPVRTQELPARTGAVRSLLVTSGDPVQVAKEDLTRSRLVLISQDEPIYVAYGRDQVSAGLGWWPALEPLEIRTVCEVWIAAVGTDAYVSVRYENWTA